MDIINPLTVKTAIWPFEIRTHTAGYKIRTDIFLIHNAPILNLAHP